MADSRTLLNIVLSLLAVFYLLDTYFCRRKHPNEPTCIRPRIPLIGHAIGLARYGGKYYAMVCNGQAEMVTLPIFNFRIYVTNSRHMMPAIQKNARTVSFRPFARVAAERYCRTSPHFVSLHDEPNTYLNDLFRETRNVLAPGKQLDHQNLGTGNSITKFLLELEQDTSDGVLTGLALYDWTKHVVSIAATDGVYGLKNPFQNPEVEANHWRWQAGIAKMTAGLPSIFLRKEWQALSILTTAFERYFSDEHDDVAAVVGIREAACDRNNASLEDKAASIVGFNLALLGNTVPTAFWALYDIVSRPELLDAVRHEVQHIITRTGQCGHETFEIDVVGLRTSCPILLSSYQETQRFRNVFASIRKIVADTTIESPTTRKSYFLTEGNYLQMPSNTIHHDPDIWGVNAGSFDPYRFVKDDVTTPREKLPESSAFMAWGIAPHICPARQFASTEVMLFVAMVIMRFDIEDSRGEWQEPDPQLGEVSTILPPKTEVFVDVRRRDRWQGTWKLKMGDSRQKVPLASG